MASSRPAPSSSKLNRLRRYPLDRRWSTQRSLRQGFSLAYAVWWFPGIGTIHRLWASSQASATRAGVAPLRSATALIRSTRATSALRASGEKRGTMFRKSVGSTAAVGSSTALTRLKIDAEAKLGGNHHLLPNRLERLAHQLFIHEWPVSFGGIEEGHAAIMSGTGGKGLKKAAGLAVCCSRLMAGWVHRRGAFFVIGRSHRDKNVGHGATAVCANAQVDA